MPRPHLSLSCAIEKMGRSRKFVFDAGLRRPKQAKRFFPQVQHRLKRTSSFTYWMMIPNYALPFSLLFRWNLLPKLQWALKHMFRLTSSALEPMEMVHWRVLVCPWPCPTKQLVPQERSGVWTCLFASLRWNWAPEFSISGEVGGLAGALGTHCMSSEDGLL